VRRIAGKAHIAGTAWQVSVVAKIKYAHLKMDVYFSEAPTNLFFK
jgi:hypothetical protein